MTNIKSYTDIEQSKKLTKILPLESADMYYPWYIEEDRDTIGSGHRISIPSVGNFIHKVNKMILPCWSLSALISVIPQEIFDGEYIINITEGTKNKWVLIYDHHENRSHSYYGLSTYADNLIDACVDIIIKLKERNII